MNYFKINGDVLEKYEITFNLTELNALKKQIIDECSEIVHHEKTLPFYPTPSMENKAEFRNVESTFVREDKKLFSKRVVIYNHYRFDEYRYSRLVLLINDLIWGNAQVIDDIDNPVVEPKKDYTALVLEKTYEYDMCEDNEASWNKLDELQTLIQKAILNKNQKDDLAFYPQVQALIKRKLVATIALSDILKTAEMFDLPLNTFGLKEIEQDNSRKLIYSKFNPRR